MKQNLKNTQTNIMESTGSYVDECDNIIVEMQKQIDKGHEIVWSTNERWCTIGNKTFNVAKTLFDTWVSQHRLKVTA